MSKKDYKKNKTLEEIRDIWDKWPVQSQIYRFTDILAKENRRRSQIKQELDGEEDFQMRFLFETEEDRGLFIREMLVDLKFKVLFFLHILIERGDKDAVLFALKELIQKGFVNEEIEKIDEATLSKISDFFQQKTGTQ